MDWIDWIDCKTDLPEDGNSVIIFAHNHNYEYTSVTIGYLTSSKYLKAEEEQQWCSFDDYFDMDYVSHWMPLPKPPKTTLNHPRLP